MRYTHELHYELVFKLVKFIRDPQIQGVLEREGIRFSHAWTIINRCRYRNRKANAAIKRVRRWRLKACMAPHYIGPSDLYSPIRGFWV